MEQIPFLTNTSVDKQMQVYAIVSRLAEARNISFESALELCASTIHIMSAIAAIENIEIGDVSDNLFS